MSKPAKQKPRRQLHADDFYLELLAATPQLPPSTAAELNSFIQTIIHPKLFRRIEVLCVTALSASNNNLAIRKEVARLSLEMRLQAVTAFGHNTLDSMALNELLTQTDPLLKRIRLTRSDPVEELSDILNQEQTSAAKAIQHIWQAFGKFLNYQIRSYSGGGGGNKKARALQPMDVISQATWDTYNLTYKPWYQEANKRTVVSVQHIRLSHVEIVIKVLVEEFDLGSVDGAYGLKPGTAQTILLQELTAFATVRDSYLSLFRPEDPK